MTLVGLVVPGIPTVPFLLATSFYLARSSPSMNERLAGRRFSDRSSGSGKARRVERGVKGQVDPIDRNDRGRDGGPRATDAPRIRADSRHLITERLRGHENSCTHERLACQRLPGIGTTLPILARRARPVTDAGVPG